MNIQVNSIYKWRVGSFPTGSFPTVRNSTSRISVRLKHRLRPIDTHLAQYTMLYNNSAKNRYAEPVLNKTKEISKIRD